VRPVTLRPEFEVGPGGLKDGFVMVSGLGPSWSASEVATLRWRVRTATLYERLAALTAAGRLGKSDQGYRLAGR